MSTFAHFEGEPKAQTKEHIVALENELSHEENKPEPRKEIAEQIRSELARLRGEPAEKRTRLSGDTR